MNSAESLDEINSQEYIKDIDLLVIAVPKSKRSMLYSIRSNMEHQDHNY